MKTTERFDRAITKLYNAFHDGALDAMDCKHCAVGNLCDNDGSWINLDRLEFGREHSINDEFVNNTGYSNLELAEIEDIFIHGVIRGFSRFSNTVSNRDVEMGYRTKEEQKELQFKGLCAVVLYLCELDGIEDVMNIQSLFEYEDNKPKKQLSEVL